MIIQMDCHGNLGGSDSWEDAGSWQHSGSIQRSRARGEDGVRDLGAGPDGLQLGVHPEALRSWVKQAEIDDGERPAATTGDKQRIAELEREVREPRRANEILKVASAYFARELDPRLPRYSSSLTRAGTGAESSRPALSWSFPCRRISTRRNARRSRRYGKP
jgi:transposase